MKNASVKDETTKSIKRHESMTKAEEFYRRVYISSRTL